MYELKPGQGTIFKNSKKTKDSQPEYRGEIVTPEGYKYEISLWVKKGTNGSFFSCSIKEPYVKPEKTNEPENNTPEPDDLPF